MTTKPTPASVAREIKRRNRVFTAASPAQKRILLAKDAIVQIKRGRFKASQGNWTILNTFDGTSEADSVQQILLDGSITCQTCALGSLIVSCVLFKNQVTVEDANRRFALEFDSLGEDPMGLRDYFDMEQLKLIELAFEGRDGHFGSHALYNAGGDGDPSTNITDSILFNPIELKAVEWKKRYRSPKARLLAIMANVVKNGGTFVP